MSPVTWPVTVASSLLLLVIMPLATSSFLVLVAMHFVSSSFLLLCTHPKPTLTHSVPPELRRSGRPTWALALSSPRESFVRPDGGLSPVSKIDPSIHHVINPTAFLKIHPVASRMIDDV